MYLIFGSLRCNKIETRHLVCIVKIHQFLRTTANCGRLEVEAELILKQGNGTCRLLDVISVDHC